MNFLLRRSKYTQINDGQVNSLHIRVNSIRDVFLELFCDFKMGLFFLAITASIVQRLERLLSFALRRKQVYGELFVSHVFVVGELPNVA